MNQEQLDCSDDELAEFLHRSLVLEMYPEHNDSNAPTDVGLVRTYHTGSLYLAAYPCNDFPP